MPKGFYERRAPVDRFFDKISPEPNTGCWLWTAGVVNNGYGQFRHGGKSIMAHRFSYEYEHGAIPPDLQIDHLCRVRCCVNPKHLRIVTCRENVLAKGAQTVSAIAAAKTHCKYGHPFEGDNLLIVHKTGFRRCRICRNRRAREDRKRWREQAYGA